MIIMLSLSAHRVETLQFMKSGAGNDDCRLGLIL